MQASHTTKQTQGPSPKQQGVPSEEEFQQMKTRLPFGM